MQKVSAEYLRNHPIYVPVLNHSATYLRVASNVCQNPQAFWFFLETELNCRASRQKRKKLQYQNFICLYHIMNLVVLRMNCEISDPSQHKKPWFRWKFRIINIVNNLFEMVDINNFHMIFSGMLRTIAILKLRGHHDCSLKCFLHVRSAFSL